MVSFKLIVVLIAAVIAMAIHRHFNPPPPKPRKIEVGKSLAQARMRRLGVEDDWRKYRTPGLAWSL